MSNIEGPPAKPGGFLFLAKPVLELVLPGRISLTIPNDCVSTRSHCREIGKRRAVMDAKQVVGVDVSKVVLDVAGLGEMPEQCPNEPEAIETLIKRLQAMGAVLVVMEASGGYETPATSVADLVALAAWAGIAAGLLDDGGGDDRRHWDGVSI